MQIRVYYEDVDVGGVVYHSKYLNFCERARSEYFFQKGKLPVFDGYSFVVKKIEADFVKPAFFGDILEIKSVVRDLKKASLTMTQRVIKEESEIFVMDVELVCVKEGKIAKIPPYFLEVLQG